jgi:CheY-like chemotaxis protein
VKKDEMQKVSNILFVDDDSDDQYLFRTALESVDKTINLQIADSGDDAFEILNHKVLPDVIVLDLNMPMMGGREFLQSLKQRPVFKDLPVIIFSTSSNPKDKEETNELGAVGFITKPSEYGELCSYVKTIAEREWESL